VPESKDIFQEAEPGLCHSFPYAKAAAQSEQGPRDPGSEGWDGLAELACRVALLPLRSAASQGGCVGRTLPLITGIDYPASLLYLCPNVVLVKLFA